MQLIHVVSHFKFTITIIGQRGWAKASASRFQVSLYCAVLCHFVLLQYLSWSSLDRLACLPCRILCRMVQGADTLGPSVVFGSVDVPCPFRIRMHRK